jgi:hypothetical protein
MKDLKLYFTKESYEELKNGESTFGYAFDSLSEAHRKHGRYYGDIEIMQKVRADKTEFYCHNGDVCIFEIKN